MKTCRVGYAALTHPTKFALTNQRGAALELSDGQVGLMANADLSGLAITMK